MSICAPSDSLVREEDEAEIPATTSYTRTVRDTLDSLVLPSPPPFTSSSIFGLSLIPTSLTSTMTSLTGILATPHHFTQTSNTRAGVYRFCAWNSSTCTSHSTRKTPIVTPISPPSIMAVCFALVLVKLWSSKPASVV
ncbi:hypothetical protein CPC08DRAFT_250935 [Agrocybe pediades]|nr:hypothetical protein CPC08DRAFT_250935 [Agrocybe pediades]